VFVHEVVGILYLLLPLLGGAVVHGVCWRYNFLNFLARPIDGGHKFRGKRVFGQNKTWRGPVAVAFGAAIVLEVQKRILHEWPIIVEFEFLDYTKVCGWQLGAMIGAASEFSELPNSFVKRQLDIAPGGTSSGWWATIFYLWDQLDVLLGVWLVLAAVTSVALDRVLWSIVLVLIIHPLTTVVGYGLGMRPTVR
jgi:hypothetical protein